MEMQGYDPVMIENNLEHFEIIDGEINLDKLESGEEIILVAYNEVIFRVTWDIKNNRVYSYGVRDSEIPYEKNNIKNTEEFSSVSAKLLCLICSINLYAKIKQEMKHSIVENIREL